jgi:APA family basic amino acid/polyamine antiporter
MKNENLKTGAFTGFSIVVANMIGTGVFTSLGFQLESLQNTWTILALWIIGGIVALSGAFSYAETGTLIKESGGEYTFLSRLYHPVVGYLSGWISLTVGFAAPIALSAIAFTEYFPITLPCPRFIHCSLIFLITLIHCYNLKYSSRFQNICTVFKVLFIVLFILIGLLLPASNENALNFDRSWVREISSLPFAISLIYVSYAYSGWNAAAYITDEFKNPRRALPFALIGGTLAVTMLYTLIQFILLKHVPVIELVGKINAGSIGVEHMLGPIATPIFNTGISFLLISGISAMVWIGPRVTSSIAKEHIFWKYFKANTNGIPQKALWLQFAVCVILLFTGTFEQIMIYCGVLLNISTLLVVTGVLVLRYRERKNSTAATNFKSPFFPLFQILFIVISLWMISFAFINKPTESLGGLLNLVIGFMTYRPSSRFRFFRKEKI